MYGAADLHRTDTWLTRLPARSLQSIRLRWLASIEHRVRLWRERSYERRMLAMMSERDLADIGCSKADAWREVNKPFWQA